MDILTTELFRFTTTAGPTTVWQTLTTPTLTSRYLHGLALESEWRPGATVTARGRWGQLVGEVLAVEEPRRLSFTLAVDEAELETFVTWEVHRAGDGSHREGSADTGSIVRLYVDEPAGDHDDTASAWLPVVSALQSVLAEAERTMAPTSR